MARWTAKRAAHLGKEKKRVERTGGANPEQRAALAQARAVRDRALVEINRELKPQIERLQREMLDRRAKAWDEYDGRVAMIRKATILEPAKA